MNKNRTVRQKTATFLTSRTGRLSLTYLGLIMVMSISGSIVVYTTASRQLERQLPPPAFYERGEPMNDRDADGGQYHRVDFDDFFEKRIDEGSEELLERLVLLNVLALVLGSFVSYWLARRMFRPAEGIIATQRRLLEETGKFPELKELESLKESIVTPRPLALRSVVTEAVANRPQRKKDIVLNPSLTDVSVIGDKKSLVRLIQILLENAVKYSADSTPITISAKQTTDTVLLIIRDEGIGIPRSDLPHVFEEFYQADHTVPTRNRTGQGLGLAIAQVLAKKNSAKLSVKSAPEQGTTVTVRLQKAQ